MEWVARELAELSERGLLRRLREIPSGMANFSSNDYLGLTRHPDVRRAAEAAAERFGAGGGASRLLAGHTALHARLEASLAAFCGMEAALVFGSGYQANVGAITALAAPGDALFLDRLCHASIIDGARLSGARIFAFDHNSADHLESLLRTKRGGYRRAFVLSEGVFSMDGDRAMLQEMVYLCGRWDAHVFLDEAHSLGMLGPEGRGLAMGLGLSAKVDVFVGTLSKALASQGGFVAGSRQLMDLLVSRARPFLYSTALAPPCAAAAEAALGLLPQMETRRQAVLRFAEDVRQALLAHGFALLASQSQIVPVWTGEVETTARLAQHLFDRGFFVPSIRPPTVPVGEGRVRLSITHGVTENGAASVTDAFAAFAPGTPRPRRRVGQKD